MPGHGMGSQFTFFYSLKNPKTMIPWSLDSPFLVHQNKTDSQRRKSSSRARGTAMSSRDGEMAAPRRMRKRRNYDTSSDDERVPKSAEEEDRISSLTDELIHKILSFMNTKYAVQTCVLSKRWQSLWKSLPYLDFNDETFPFKGVSGEGQCQKDDPDKIISFNNFITQVLFRRQHTNLLMVRLNFLYTEPNAFMVEGLIAYAVDHNVRQLTILRHYDADFPLPESFYTCQSLAALYMDDTVPLLRFLALPALKYLHLHHLRMSGSFLNARNFSGCPNLETLILSNIFLDGEGETLVINAPNLKRLKLTFQWAYEKDRCNGCKVVIDAPGLTAFQYRGYVPIVCSSDGLASIDDVCFDIYNKYTHISVEEETKILDMDIETSPNHIFRLINTFKEFQHAKSLMLSLETLKVLAAFPSLLDENELFSNLKYLKINLGRWQRCNEVDIPGCALNFFLNCSTKVQIL